MGTNEKKLNKKMAQSMNGLDDPNLADESPFNTGIYRKKGHLNERAFSYSIRQEHRSRSYGSLANLKFATPIPNGDVSFCLFYNPFWIYLFPYLWRILDTYIEILISNLGENYLGPFVLTVKNFPSLFSNLFFDHFSVVKIIHSSR